MLFFRGDTDKLRDDCSFLKNQHASVTKTPVWIVGAGPSFTKEQADLIKSSGVMVCCMNFSGRGKDGDPPLIWPHIWTAFDPSPRFLGSIFLDHKVQKFVLGGRFMDLIPGTGTKICEAPNLYCVDTEFRPYSRFIDPNATKQIGCRDTFCLTITILYSLGFRKLYCAGTEMAIRLSEAQVELCKKHKIEFLDEDCTTFNFTNDKRNVERCDLLPNLVKQLIANKMAGNRTDVSKMMSEVEREKQYSFCETKSFQAAVVTDEHYWRIVQYLRLSRKNMSLNGLEIISCTEKSRLNAFFPYENASDVAGQMIYDSIDPATEETKGRYSNVQDPDAGLPYHRDFPSHEWNVIKENEERKRKGVCPECISKPKPIPAPVEQEIDIQDQAGQKRADIIKRFKELEGQPEIEGGVIINEKG